MWNKHFGDLSCFLDKMSFAKLWWECSPKIEIGPGLIYQLIDYLGLAVAQSVGTWPQNLRMAGFLAQHGTVSMEYWVVVGEVPVHLLGKASLDQGTKTLTAQAAWYKNVCVQVLEFF